jgi:hypothetical protein
MRPFIIFIVICLTSCTSKYSADRYVIPESYRNVVSSYKAGDTLRFKDSKGNFSLYLITTIDSSFVDEGKGLMSVRGRKDISITCRELTNSRKGYEEYSMVILNKYPDEDSATFDLRLKDFYGIDATEQLVLRTDSIKANDLIFTNYYVFRSENSKEQRDPNSVVEIYMTKDDGIIAYKNLNGTWWTKRK